MAEKILVSVEQFAKWSFLRDKSAGCYRGEKNNAGRRISDWSSLDSDDRETYLDEAKHYISKVPRADWPEDILNRLK